MFTLKLYDFNKTFIIYFLSFSIYLSFATYSLFH